MEFFVKIQATAEKKMGTKYLWIFSLTSLLSDYTLRNKIRVSVLFCTNICTSLQATAL